MFWTTIDYLNNVIFVWVYELENNKTLFWYLFFQNQAGNSMMKIVKDAEFHM